MKIETNILKRIRSIIDIVIILVILVDFWVNGLSDWLLISFILFIPSNILYFIGYKRDKIKPKKELTKKPEKNIEKALISVR